MDPLRVGLTHRQALDLVETIHAARAGGRLGNKPLAELINDDSAPEVARIAQEAKVSPDRVLAFARANWPQEASSGFDRIRSQVVAAHAVYGAPPPRLDHAIRHPSALRARIQARAAPLDIDRALDSLERHRPGDNTVTLGHLITGWLAEPGEERTHPFWQHVRDVLDENAESAQSARRLLGDIPGGTAHADASTAFDALAVAAIAAARTTSRAVRFAYGGKDVRVTSASHLTDLRRAYGFDAS